MHICFVSTYSPTPCGIATYCSYLIDGLLSIDAKLRITVLAERPVENDAFSRVRVINAFSKDSDYERSILHQVRSTEPDVVHIQHEYGIFGFDNRFLRLLTCLREIRVPIIVTLHTVHTRFSLDASCCWAADRRLPAHLDIERLQQKLCELSNLIVVHQDWPMRNALIEQGASPNRIACICHGTLTETGIPRNVAKQRLGYAANTPLLVAFGYFEPSKNHQRLLEAFSLLRRARPDARLWIGGHVRWPSFRALKYKAEIVNSIDKMRLREYVTLREEAVPESEVPMLLGAADIGCFVYREDTFSSSGAAHRMLGAGKPIVASRIPKFHELRRIAPEILVDPDSPQEFADILERLLDDDTFRTLITTKTLKFATETSWPLVADAHVQVYRRTIAQLLGELTPEIGSSDAQANTGYLRGA